jgi:hypothetical protein
LFAEEFNEIVDMVYVAKRLFDIGKYKLVQESFSDVLDYDNYYCGMYELVNNLFEYSTCNFYEQRNFELHVLSCPAMVDFYVLAGEYGKLHGIPDSENSYIINASDEVDRQLNISHCLDWKLMAHTKPARPFHSRIGIFISHDCGCCDIGTVTHRLINIYEWYEDYCVALRTKISKLKQLPARLYPNRSTERRAIAA